jgi:hypothetical protein
MFSPAARALYSPTILAQCLGFIPTLKEGFRFPALGLDFNKPGGVVRAAISRGSTMRSMQFSICERKKGSPGGPLRAGASE